MTVFVSYARTDYDRVRFLVERLQRTGVLVWLDDRDLGGASFWPEEIVRAIEQCSVLLLMISPASANSEHVAREVILSSECKKPILPLFLEPTDLPPRLAYHLAGIQHLDVF